MRRYRERGWRFVWSLTVPPPQVETSQVMFGGDCLLTSNRMVVEEIAGESVFWLMPRDISQPIPP
ncbi:MAG: hypothetical protein JJ956_11300 [Pseudomonadales bacterium]|nr:hypothetical protein [Pseudomonadales bacterium]MBO6597896.1 hypothetical protein [Pseudomonadales bacterium]